MVFGNTLRHLFTFLFEFMETEGQLLMLITFGLSALLHGLSAVPLANLYGQRAGTYGQV